METNLQQELLDRVLGADFMRLGVSVRHGGEMARQTARRILLRGETCYQVEETVGTKKQAKNFSTEAMRDELLKMLDAPGAWEIHATTATGDLHIRRTRKGRVLVSRSKPLQREAAAVESHDRKKEHPLDQFDSRVLLQAVGIAGPDGAVRASMRGKYDQVNAFLREVGESVRDVENGAEFLLLDAGCGLAYLTFAAHGWLAEARGLRVKTVGVDKNEEIISTCRQAVLPTFRPDDISFICSDLTEVSLGAAPDLVISLHACDTATDEALARAVEWESRRILCAPCCQHELHAGLKHDGAMRGVLRHGILRERLCDVLTDTFRAQILRVCGYRVKVVEFVAPEATARNVMIRAEAGVKPGVKPGAADAVEEYLALRDFWGVEPWLEKRLAGTPGLENHFTRRRGDAGISQ